MSRFGIRRKLRGLMGQSSKPTYQTYRVTYVLPDGTRQVVEAEERHFANGLQSLPSPIGTGRRAGGTCPDGRCALCQVEVLDSSGLTEMNDYERNSLDGFVAGTPTREESGNQANPMDRTLVWLVK